MPEQPADRRGPPRPLARMRETTSRGSRPVRCRVRGRPRRPPPARPRRFRRTAATPVTAVGRGPSCRHRPARRMTPFRRSGEPPTVAVSAGLRPPDRPPPRTPVHRHARQFTGTRRRGSSGRRQAGPVGWAPSTERCAHPGVGIASIVQAGPSSTVDGQKAGWSRNGVPASPFGPFGRPSTQYPLDGPGTAEDVHPRLTCRQATPRPGTARPLAPVRPAAGEPHRRPGPRPAGRPRTGGNSDGSRTRPW